MRYNPSTDKARTIEDLAQKARQAVEVRLQQHRPNPLKVSRQDFYADACKTWAVCRDVAIWSGDRLTAAQMDYNLDRDMHIAMNHRPWQPEY